MDERDFRFGMSKVFFKAGKVSGVEGVGWGEGQVEEGEEGEEGWVGGGAGGGERRE